MKLLKRLPWAAPAAACLAAAGVALADDQASAPTPAGGSTPATAAPAVTPMANPSLGPTLVAYPNPPVFDAGPLGKITVDGVIDALAMYQSTPAADIHGRVNQQGYGDLGNAQIIINKSDGVVQFYFQAGAYSVPSLGTPYYKATRFDSSTYGYVPQGFVKIVPNATFNIEVGALPTLIGNESVFTFQNYNIARGLVWNQTPDISRGVQFNLTQGALAFSFAVTDGYFSGAYSSIAGLATYTFKNSDTLTFEGQGNASTPRTNTFVAPAQLNDGMIYDLIYIHTSGPWTLSPYIQYNSSQYVPGVSRSGYALGAALLAKYSFTPLWSLAGRIEYIGSSGAADLLTYGDGSDAFSLTLTPTFRKGIFFARGDVSFVGIGGGVRGLEFGPTGESGHQFRALLETGVMF